MYIFLLNAVRQLESASHILDNLIDETGKMHSQNEELKNLLNNYLQINHDLIIPPTQLMEKGD